MMGVGASEFAFMWIFMLGGFGLPLGLPPEAEDPLMARIAPPQCLIYGTWAGMAQPNAMSANQTERLLAEPDVQRAIRGIERFVQEAGLAPLGVMDSPLPGPAGNVEALLVARQISRKAGVSP